MWKFCYFIPFLLQILDFCKQRILFDFCGEQLQSFSSQDNEIRRQHETFMRKKGSVVLGREDVLLKVNMFILLL